MPHIIETTEEFKLRHGVKTVKCPKQRNVWLLPSGAALIYDMYGYQHREPPRDPYELLKARRNFQTVVLAGIEQDFKALKQSLLGGPNGQSSGLPFRWDARCEEEYGPNPRNGPAALLTIKNHVLKIRAVIADIDLELAATPQVQAAKLQEAEAKRLQSERDAKVQELRNEIEAINI